MLNSLRVAHCSDIHLDSDRQAPSFYREAFASSLRCIHQHKPHLLLLAGDVFDTNSASDETIRWAMELLEAQPYPVAMIPGNHDCLSAEGIYRRYDFNAISNVFMADAPEGSLHVIDDLDVAIWGKGMEEHCPTYFPLAGAPPKPATYRWYLGMGHGLYVPQGQSTDRSSPIPHQTLVEAPFDYLALGHHHAALTLATHQGMAAFSGSPTDTLGGHPTYAIAELSSEGVHVRIVPVVKD